MKYIQRKIKNGRMVPTPRETEMYTLWKTGLTLQEVGNRFGVTREYVRLVLKRNFGLTRKDNIVRNNSLTANMIQDEIERRNKFRYKEDMRYSGLFGCSKEAFILINGGSYTKNSKNYSCHAFKYLTQKRNANLRGIPWNLTFNEWWDVWQESGKYHLRGRGNGYTMGRYGDSGAYEIGNVYICTGAQNTSDQYLVRAKGYQKSHCSQGHERTEDNLYKTGVCKICHRIKSKFYYDQKHNAASMQATA